MPADAPSPEPDQNKPSGSTDGASAGAGSSRRDRNGAGGDMSDTPLPMPEDTAEILTGSSPDATPIGGRSGSRTSRSNAGGDSADSNGSGSTAGGSRGMSGTGVSLDTIVGRLVVEQGLATNDEVTAALERQKVGENQKANDLSLAQVLVDDGAITQKQLERLRKQVEAERSGQQIPGFKIQAKVGAGAMAAVFKAKQISLDRLVAIKVLPRKFNGNRQFIERFYAEGRAAAQLNHPNIVQAYDVGRAGEFHYFVMEYVEGGTVHDQIVSAKRFEEREALDIVINIADALQHAHEKGLIHRDVKPKNIMKTKSGVAKLADLGLARAIDDKDAALAEKGKAYGTPYYISPEQIRGEVNVGPQADIYSLGATLYHMITGNVPFDGKNPKEVMEKHLKDQLVPPDHVNPRLSAGISEVVEMMMAKSRRDRYKSCADLLVDLRAIVRGEEPPIAHRETTHDDLSQVAAMAAASTDTEPYELPEDRSQAAGADRRMQLMVSLAVLLGVWAITATVLALL
jgi:serine/threonine-protein kinase